MNPRLSFASIGCLRLLAAALLAACCAPAGAQALDATPIEQEIKALAAQQVAGAGPTRVDVSVGALDPRLKLAPCSKVQPHLPPGTRVWGTFRVGLRCVDGPVRWNVYLPVTVRVFGPALVAAASLPAGTDLSAANLKLAEVDLAASAAATFASVQPISGRILARAVAGGEAVRADALRARQWFAAGDTVTVAAAGSGFAVALQAQALGPGLEGQSVRARTEAGRILTGLAVGPRKMEVRL